MPDGMFINVKINEKIRADLEMANKVVESCPVDIFIIEKDTLQTQEKYLDECITIFEELIKDIKIKNGNSTL